MNWSDFIWFAIPAMLCWLGAGTGVYLSKNRVVVDMLVALGTLLFISFIILLWIGLQRPPMRTIGETRLWYSLFLIIVGYAGYRRWRYGWLLSFSALVASVFVVINLLKPEIGSITLMPALQSYWFIPHVTVYILSYAMMGAGTIASIIQLNNLYKKREDPALYTMMDNVIYIGFGFLMLGLLMGALWAKQAWGHYWSWDPKETWALITSAAYLLYIHMRLERGHRQLTLWMLPLSFILLMVTWIGVNYLPAAQSSIHVY